MFTDRPFGGFHSAVEHFTGGPPARVPKDRYGEDTGGAVYDGQRLGSTR